MNQATEIEAATVSELFARDPLKLSDRDIDATIRELRAARGKFVQGNLTAGKLTTKKPTTKTAALAADVDLGDLGL